MKRILSIVFLLGGLSVKGFSQDKIITTANDTVECKINKIWHNSIYFDLYGSGIKSSGEIPLAKVSCYSISGKETMNDPRNFGTDLFKKIRFGINGGAGYLLGSTGEAKESMLNTGISFEQAESYYNDLKTGFYAGADLTYMINKKYGIGIKYKFFDTSARIEDLIDPHDGENLIYATYSEQIYVNYFGPTLLYNQYLGRKKSLKATSVFSLGLSAYRNEAEYLKNYILLTGNGLGTECTVGLEYLITPNFSVGADISAYFSAIRKMKISDGTSTTKVNLGKENSENISRLDLSIGIRLYL